MEISLHGVEFEANGVSMSQHMAIKLTEIAVIQCLKTSRERPSQPGFAIQVLKCSDQPTSAYLNEYVIT